MTKKKIDIHKLKERERASTPVTDDDREFMRQMEERMPNLSVRHNPDPSIDDDEKRPSGWYLRKFRKDSACD